MHHTISGHTTVGFASLWADDFETDFSLSEYLQSQLPATQSSIYQGIYPTTTILPPFGTHDIIIGITEAGFATMGLVNNILNQPSLAVRIYMNLFQFNPPYGIMNILPLSIVFHGAGGKDVRVSLDNTRHIQVKYWDAGVPLTDVSATIFPMNEWHILELDLMNNATELKVYYDDAELTDLRHTITPPSPTLDFGVLGAWADQVTRAYLDALIIATTPIGAVAPMIDFVTAPIIQSSTNGTCPNVAVNGTSSMRLTSHKKAPLTPSIVGAT